MCHKILFDYKTIYFGLRMAKTRVNLRWALEKLLLVYLSHSIFWSNWKTNIIKIPRWVFILMLRSFFLIGWQSAKIWKPFIEWMGDGFFGHSICKYTNGMNALCMVASITNVTTMAFDASNAAKPSQDQGSKIENQFILVTNYNAFEF